MYIEVDGKTYLISIRDSEKNITILGQKDGILHLAVAARLSQDELIAYLKSKAFNKSTYIKQNEYSAAINTVELFECIYNLIPHKDISQPYIKGKSLYVKNIPQGSTALNNLLENTLLQELKQQIGFWEETMKVLINDIYIRKLKTNYYTICSKNSRLTFEKALLYKSRDFIAYISASAVFDYLSIADSQREELANQYIKDWKHHQRVFLYELENLK